MMWFFAILVVLAMGGVAALAAGRGAPMSEAYDDRPDALVPRDGQLRSGDVRKVRFSLAFRGYRMSEVDALLDRVALQLELAELPPPAVGSDPDAAGQGDVVDAPSPAEPRGEHPPL
jgi:DivIVA domain-containing protein